MTPQQYGPPQQQQQNFNAARFGGGSSRGGFSQGFLDYLAEARAMKLRQSEANLRQSEANLGKTGAETRLTEANVEDMYGRTDPSRSKMAYTQSQIDTSYGRTDPSKASMYASYAGANADLMRAGGSTQQTLRTPSKEISITSPLLGIANPTLGAQPSPFGIMPTFTSSFKSSDASGLGTSTPFSGGNFFKPTYTTFESIPANQSKEASLKRYSDAYDRYLRRA